MADIDEGRIKIGELNGKPVFTDGVLIEEKGLTKKELVKIKGIGKETAEDILKLYVTKEDLIRALDNDQVPLRNDIVIKLNNHYKGGS